MKLADAVGKKVVLTFKSDAPFYVSRLDGDRLTPVLMQGPNGAQPLSLPFLLGDVIPVGDSFAIQYSERDVLGPNGDTSRKCITLLNPDCIATITYAVEQRVAIIS